MSWEQSSPTDAKQGAGPLRAGAVLFILLTVLVLLCYVTIFVNPQIVFNPFPPPVVSLPTSTKIVKVVETPTVRPTSTPQPAFPPTWTPTITPTPTFTSTPRPTSTPTFTPGPIPQFSLRWNPIFTKQKLYPNSAGWWSGVAGEVADKAGKPVTYVTVRIWDDFGHAWETQPSNASDYANHYGSEFGSRGTYAWWEQFLFISCRESITVHIQLRSGGKAVSPVVTVKTTGDCEKNLILVHFQKNY